MKVQQAAYLVLTGAMRGTSNAPMGAVLNYNLMLEFKCFNRICTGNDVVYVRVRLSTVAAEGKSCP